MTIDVKDEIIRVVKEIFSNGTFCVETVNENALVGLMAENGTPITDILNNPRAYRTDIDVSIVRKDYIEIQNSIQR